jgi:hypothetical protein
VSVNEGLTGAWVTALGPSGRLVTDYSPYRQHATMTGGVTLASWSRGWSANYSGSTGATLAYSKHLHTGFPFSVAAWAKYIGAGSSGREIFHSDTDTGTTFSGWSVGAQFAGSVNKDVFLLRYGNGTTVNRTLRASGPVDLVVDDWYHVAISISAHITGDIWINGVSTGSAWAGSATGLAHAAGTARIGYDTRTSRAWTNEIADVRTWGRAITEEEVRELYSGGPGYCLRPPRRRTLVRVLTTGTTGSGSSTLAAATSTASGTQTFAGTVSPTLAAATSTASGTQTIPGTSSTTLAAATGSAAGTQTFSGTAAATLGDVSASASGALSISGSAAATLGDVVAAAEGLHTDGPTGALAVGLAATAASANGAQTIGGSAAATLGDVIASASGNHIGSVSGSAAVQSAATTASASGAVSITGSCGSTSGETTGSGSGICQTNGSVSVALAASEAVAVGTVGAGTVAGAAAVALSDTSATALASVTVVGMCVATTPPVSSSAYALATTADVLLVGHTGTATLTGAVGTANLKGRKIWA